MDQITFEHLPTVVGEIRERLLRIEEHLENLRNSDPSSKHLMTISEAALFLSLSTSTIYSKVCKMEIPVHKQGKRLYFERSELYEWIKNGRRKTAEELHQEAERYLKSAKMRRRR
ncbi:helix-turn-helix domain-containing protein [Dyadobacter sp. CY312]|uniref:helix-turn-helix domain-containing protein n=1 Tax=Dyadobacter sp. CY312 TaxID=2907303 RepID=UPI001F2EAE1C|nr:helix-turn-helix domain-containing protein [Dyadobacter sp. CY312]MCE7041390.1 helix-turn-helix domain-containing protein [Dyadobacter sp. CY312]